MNNIFNKIFWTLLILFFIFSKANSDEGKIKIGVLVPLTGDNKELGQSIIKATRMAIKDINASEIEIFPKDSGSDPSETLRSASEFKELGVNIVIGPIFNNNLIYLEELKDITFLSFTNKNINLPKNVISVGINASSQINAIKKFIDLNEIKKTILLTPNLEYKIEVKKAIKETNIKIYKHYIYDTEPTKLTAQIEKITNYKVRKQNLIDEIKRVENSDLIDKDKQLEKLKRDTQLEM